MSASPIPDSFSLAKDGDSQDAQVKNQDGNGEQVSAADYDPSLDRREDEKKLAMGNGHHPEANDVEIVEEEVEEEEDDDVDDMFAVDKPEKKKVKKVKRVLVSPCTSFIPLEG